MGFFVPAAMLGLSMLKGALGKGQKKSTQELNRTTNFNQTGSSSFDRSTQPIISEDSMPLRGQLFNQFSSELRRPGNLAQDQVNQFGVGQRARIGRQTNNFQQDLSRILRQQGLGSSAVAALQRGSAEQFRGQQFGDLEEQLQRQRLQALEFDEQNRMRRLQEGAGFLSSIPIGQREFGTQNMERSGTETMRGTDVISGQQGGGWRGALGGAVDFGMQAAAGEFAGKEVGPQGKINLPNSGGFKVSTSNPQNQNAYGTSIFG